MPVAVVVLADGCEEIEAVTPIDVLRRAGVEVVAAGLTARTVRGAHGLEFAADALLVDAPTDPDAIVLPGGMPGAANLGADEALRARVRRVAASGGVVAAICAAPAMALGPTGVLVGRRATCYPGFEDRLGAGVTFTDQRMVVDGPFVTSRGPGTALEFSLAIVTALVGPEVAARLASGMLVAPA